MSIHPASPPLAYTDYSRAEMLKGIGEAMAELRYKAKTCFARRQFISALQLHRLHGRVMDTVVDVVRDKSDPGTDSIRIQLIALDAARIKHASRASDLLTATARQTSVNAG